MSEANELGKKVEKLVKLPIGLLKDAAAGYVREMETTAKYVIQGAIRGFDDAVAREDRDKYDGLAEELACVCVAALMKGGEKKP